MSSETREATETMRRAYAAGREHSGLTLLAAWEREIYGAARVNPESPSQVASFEAGVAGHEPPRWVSGWRYGSIPAGGYSRNHRDDCAERGVSIMALDGEPSRTDGTFELFNSCRPRVRIAGWLIGFRGSDGEALVVGAVEI